MKNLIGQYEVTYNKKPFGKVTLTLNGLMLQAVCRCEYIHDGVFRLVCLRGKNTMSFGILIPKDNELTLSKSFSKNQLSGILSEGTVSFLIIPADAELSSVIQAEDNNIEEVSVLDVSPTSQDAVTEDITEEAYESPIPAQEDDSSFSKAFQETIDTSKTPENIWTPIQDPASLFNDDDMKSICRELNDVLIRREGEITLFAVPLYPDRPFPMMPVFCCGETYIIDDKTYVVFSVKDGQLCEQI